MRFAPTMLSAHRCGSTTWLRTISTRRWRRTATIAKPAKQQKVVVAWSSVVFPSRLSTELFAAQGVSMSILEDSFAMELHGWLFRFFLCLFCYVHVSFVGPREACGCGCLHTRACHVQYLHPRSPCSRVSFRFLQPGHIRHLAHDGCLEHRNQFTSVPLADRSPEFGKSRT